MSMPFYVSPEQSMRDKADYARKGIARSRSCVALQYAGGILMVAPNPSSALHKISEIYDRIAFAAVGRYNEYEALRKAGVTYADVTGYQFDRARRHRARPGELVRADARRDLHRLDASRTRWRSWSPRSASSPDDDQIYRITCDGSVSDEPGFVAFGGQADQVAAALKERFSDGMSLTEALGAALAALAAPPAQASGLAGSAAGNGAQAGADRRPPGGRDPGPGPRPPHLPPPARPAPGGAPGGKPRRLRRLRRRRRRGPRIRLRRPRGPGSGSHPPGLRRTPHRPALGQRRRHPEAVTPSFTPRSIDGRRDPRRRQLPATPSGACGACCDARPAFGPPIQAAAHGHSRSPTLASAAPAGRPPAAETASPGPCRSTPRTSSQQARSDQGFVGAQRCARHG